MSDGASHGYRESHPLKPTIAELQQEILGLRKRQTYLLGQLREAQHQWRDEVAVRMAQALVSSGEAPIPEWKRWTERIADSAYDLADALRAEGERRREGTS